MVDVALYARVSTKEKGQDTEQQLHELREYCRKKEYNIYKEYVDEGSAFKESGRKEYERLFVDARKRKYSILVFWALDRFSRRGIGDTIQDLKKLDEYGVKFHSYTQPFLSTTEATGELTLAIFAYLAKQESVYKSERMIRWHASKKRKGERTGRKPISTQKRNKILKLREEGNSIRAISEKVGVSVGTTSRVCS